MLPIILAVENLIVGLLLMSVLIALAVRVRHRWDLLFPILLAPLLFVYAAPFVLGIVLGQVLSTATRLLMLGVGPAFFLGEIILVWLACREAPFVAGQMVSGPVPEAPVKRARDRGANWPAAKLAVAFGVGLVIHLGTFYMADWHEHAVLANARVEAARLSAAAEPPRVPEADNAAPLYLRAFAALDQVPDSSGRVRRLMDFTAPEPWDAKAKEEVGPLLEPYHATLLLLRQAAAKPGCRIERDYTPSLENLFGSNVEQFTRGAKLLMIDARFQAVTGNMEMATDNVNALFRMPHHVSDPSLIGTLVAIAVDSMASRTVEMVLGATPLSAAELALLRPGDSAWVADALPKALDSEEAFFLRAMATFFAPGPNERQEFKNDLPVTRVAGGLLLYRVVLLPDDMASYRTAMEGYRQALRRPYSQGRMEFAAGAFPGGHPGLITSILMPSFESACRAAVKADLRHSLAKLALALTQYQVEMGHDPDKLDQLVPQYISAIPMDPFDDQPVRMVVKDNKFVLYSVGPDMVDNGGRELDNKGVTGDLTFTLPCRQPRPRAATAP